MIYAINKADKTKEQTRKVTVDFFKNKIGFTDDEIIFVDLNEFIEHEESIEKGIVFRGGHRQKFQQQY